MKCLICHQPISHDWRPFCSKTCKNIDLIRWLREDYRIPGAEVIQKEDLEEDDDRKE